jgi:prepilin-type N-terminal cleavage/methylation domain-containing protein
MKRTASWSLLACPSKNSSTPGRRGFTLIELLVVIAIIAILAALLTAALARGKEEAYSTQCRNNLHQLGLAVEMYVDDFHVYPPYELKDQESSTAPSLFWYQRLQAYTKSQPPYICGTWPTPTNIGNNIFVCPSYARLPNCQFFSSVQGYGYNETGYWGALGSGGLGAIIDPSSYADENNAGPADVQYVCEADVFAPNDMIELGDAVLIGDTNMPLDTFGPIMCWWPIMPVMGMPPQPGAPTTGYGVDLLGIAYMKQRHLGIWNVVFCDGHVEGLTARGLFYPCDSVARRWYRDHQPHPSDWSNLIP